MTVREKHINNFKLNYRLIIILYYDIKQDMQAIKNAGTSVKNKYNKKMNDRAVEKEEKLRQRTAIYRFKTIKKMKKLYDLCLDETYDRDLRETYLLTLNNILIKKIIGINTSIEVSFKFIMNKQAEEDLLFIDTFVVFVRNCINNYNLEELKLIDRYATKFLR